MTDSLLLFLTKANFPLRTNCSHKVLRLRLPGGVQPDRSQLRLPCSVVFLKDEKKLPICILVVTLLRAP
jgi:hypothetical protein